MQNLREHQLSSVCRVVPFWLAVKQELEVEYCASNESLYNELPTFDYFHQK
jgi:hypothetical protein